MGTLYRHFPTKADLLDTVLDEDFVAWTGSARRDAAAHEDPWRALCAFMEDALARQSRQRATLQHLADAWETPAMDRCRRHLHPVIEELVGACHQAGLLRTGVGAQDVSLLLVGLGRIVELTAASSPEPWRRQLRIALDGLRPCHVEPLPPTDGVGGSEKGRTTC